MPYFTPDRLAIVGIPADDLPAALHFYLDIIGLPLLPHHDERPAFDLGHDTYLVLVKSQHPLVFAPEEPIFPALTFEVKDLDQAVDHLEAHGVKLLSGIKTSSQTRWILFHDPAGNLVEFAQFGTPPQP
jgi:catechol 2,3-dioxygenase-like lactoylglutathione lyase family enzyme